MSDEYDPLEGDASYSPGESQGEGLGLLESHPSQSTGKALSDSLSGCSEDLQARIREAASHPLRILGPDLYEEMIPALYARKNIRAEGYNRGMTFTNIGGQMLFLFRDEKYRARYVYEAMMGLTWPSTVGFLERLELYKRFEDGWTSGELGFLSGVPLADVDLYREALLGEPAVSKGTPAVASSGQPQ